MGIDARLPILTTAGWLPAKMIKAGDEIFKYTGQPVKVLSVQEYTPKVCFKIWLKEGLTLVVDGRTGIPVFDKKSKVTLTLWKRKTRRNKTTVIYPLGPERIMSHEHGWCRIPLCQPIDPPERQFPVPPFQMGAWLFDMGWVRRQKRTDITRELLERYPKIPTNIPEEYILGSFQQRRCFLLGVVSQRPNCYNPDTRRFSISSMDIKLIKQLQCLVESLGIRTSLVRTNPGFGYILMFKTHLRLVEGQEPPIMIHEIEYRRIVKIETVAPRPCVFIKTEDPNNTFLVSEGFLMVSL